MRLIEAVWLRERLSVIDADAMSPLLEIGSSTLDFRTKVKPHIEGYVHGPLRERGVKILTTDLRDAQGVDIVGDLFDPAVREKLMSVGARSILMCNLLEHIRDPAEFAGICQSFIRSGGYLIVTVPYNYPYHLDPIDTMFRPTPEEIHSLFPNTQMVEGRILTDGGLWADLRKTRNVLQTLVKVFGDLIRLITIRGGLDRAKSRASRLSYLFRNYQISVAILRLKETEIHD